MEGVRRASRLPTPSFLFLSRTRLFITMPILFHVERNNLITQCIMVKFSFLLIWCDSDTEWCHYYFASTYAMIQDRVSFFNGLSSLVKVIAFEDKEIPNHQVLEYLGDFYRVDNKVEFVNALKS